MQPERLARYAEQRLPRYTSYPTAPQFSSHVSEADYRTWLADLAPGLAASVYLHVPFCRSMCWYCGCHTTITPRMAPIADYVKTLAREIETVAEAVPHRLAIAHVHFGGGTPTILEPSDFRRVVELLRGRFDLAPEAEIAVEIDPRTLTRAMVAALGEAGVMRASLGVQSFDPAVQKAINRLQTFAQTAAAVQSLRRVGVRGINFDLIYGLPRQTIASCLDTVQQAVALRPERFSVFGYAHVPTFKKHQRKISESELPSGRARHEQAEAITGALQAAGYRRIGLDHYALPDNPMSLAQEEGALRRNFQGYTTDLCEALLGFGASAISRLPQGYVQNEVVLGRYAERVAKGQIPVAKGCALTNNDRLRADLIEQIMCNFRVDIAQACDTHGASRRDLADVLPALQAMQADGVIRMDGAVVQVEPDARHLVRTVAAAFDAYLTASPRARSPAV